jgi:hypothetical protein
MKFICALLKNVSTRSELEIQPDSVKSAMTYFSPCGAGLGGAPFWDVASTAL